MDSPQECVGEASIDRNDVTGGAAGLRTREEENRFRAVGRVYGLMRESALCVKMRQQIAKLIVAQGFLKGNVVLG